MDQASTLPDGTKVFRDGNGDVWSTDGQKIDGADLDQIEWRKGAPSYEDFLAGTKAVEHAQQEVSTIRHYQIDVLGNARNRLSDEDNPVTKDELREISKEFRDAAPAMIRPQLEGAPQSEAAPSTTASLSMPPLSN